jgi:hypothetical protein
MKIGMSVVWATISRLFPGWFKGSVRRERKRAREIKRAALAARAAHGWYFVALVMASGLMSGCAAFARNTWRLVMSLVLVATLSGCGALRTWDRAVIWVGERIGLEKPAEEPEDEPVFVPNEPALNIVELWGGVRLPDRVDPRYVLTVSEDGRNWSAAPDDWPMWLHGPAVCMAFYERAPGQWVGGKYDWLPRPPRPRDWNNVRSGYSGWVAPPSGTQMKMFAVSSDGRRSTEGSAIYR